MKKIFILFTIIFSFSLMSFARPTEKAHVNGPGISTPKREDINKLKCSKDPDFIGSQFCKNFRKEIKKEEKKTDDTFIN